MIYKKIYEQSLEWKNGFPQLWRQKDMNEKYIQLSFI